MIRCQPNSLFSLGFRIEGEGRSASMGMKWLSEQGWIQVDGTRFEIKKHGAFSGSWTMEGDGKVFASAKKPAALSRTFVLESPMGSVTLVPESIFNRRFRVERAGVILARIQPDHAFTRHSQIDPRTNDYDFGTLCFAFWLVLVTWGRSNGGNTGASG